VEGGETHRAKTESRNGDTRFDPTIIISANKTQSKVNGVACLHADKGTPDKHGRAIKEAGDNVAQ
jgi:hypothetical protein